VVAEKRFVADIMLGKLARWLRTLGFDTHYTRLDRQQQIDAYRERGFLLLTRNQRWCGQAAVICLAANDPAGQLQELVGAAPIGPHEVRLLERCLLCNTCLLEVPGDQVIGRVPDYVCETQTVFRECPKCAKLYWSGSHPPRMVQWLHSTLGWTL
jgi:uncharacterized protein